MGDVDHDVQIAQFMSMTDCLDNDLIQRLLTENAWCVELAVESYNAIKAARGPPLPHPQRGAGGGRGIGGGGDYGGGRGMGLEMGGGIPGYDPRDFQDTPPRGGGGGGGRMDGGAGRRGGNDPMGGSYGHGVGHSDSARVLDMGPSQQMAAEQNPTSRVFDSAHLRSLFKAPPYAKTIGRDGWRQACADAANSNKYMILNIQEPGNFWSHRLDRDVWANDVVRDVVMVDFVLIQVWKNGDNYNDMKSAYPGLEAAELPLIMLLDSTSRRELKRVTYTSLLRQAGVSVTGACASSARLLDEARMIAMTMVDILTNFADKEKFQRAGSVDEATSNDASPSSGPSGQQQQQENDDEEDELHKALQMSANLTGDSAGSIATNTLGAAGGAAAAATKPAVPDPDDSVDTLEGTRREAAGDGVLRLRIKLPLKGGLADWDQTLHNTTTQRAFTRGVRHEMRKRGEPVPPGKLVCVQFLDKSRKQVTAFQEAVAEAKQPAIEGPSLADTPLQAREAIWIELHDAVDSAN